MRCFLVLLVAILWALACSSAITVFLMAEEAQFSPPNEQHGPERVSSSPWVSGNVSEPTTRPPEVFSTVPLVSSVEANPMRNTHSNVTRPEHLRVECYNRRTQSSSLVRAEEFWNKPGCSLDFRKKLLFLHLGKGGGGTVKDTMKQHRILFSGCHPTPDTRHCNGDPRTAENIIINIRDPVDRFVSAFHWRSLVNCNKDKRVDPRTRNPKRQGVLGQLDLFCFDRRQHKEERSILHDTYHYNVNELAEALCQEGPQGDLARQHASKIGHATPLSEWLSFILPPHPNSIDTRNSSHTMYPSLEQIIAVVMEKNSNGSGNDYPFERTVLNALESLVGKTYPGLAPGFLSASSSSSLTATTMHSTKSFAFPGGIPRTPVSRLGECCLARHLAGDYEVLGVLAGASAGAAGVDPRVSRVCDWGTEEDARRCREGLRSMIDRRAAYLRDVSLSCREAVLLGS